jgi:hypothetical protein
MGLLRLTGKDNLVKQATVSLTQVPFSSLKTLQRVSHYKSRGPIVVRAVSKISAVETREISFSSCESLDLFLSYYT